MMLTTHYANLEPSQASKDDFCELISSAVQRFQSKIRLVNISVRDVNGPKGGIDKQCRCVVHLKRMAPIVIEDKDENFRNLFNRVADRVAYTLCQKVGKARRAGRPRKRRETTVEEWPTEI